MSWSKQVFSSMVNEIAWDDEAQEMVVTFNNGSQYAYSGVDEGTAIEGSKSPSVGQWINSEIKGKYPARKL